MQIMAKDRECGVCGTDVTTDANVVETDEFGTICVECGQMWAEYQEA